MKVIVFIECNASGTGVEAMRLAKNKGYHVKFLTREKEFYEKLEENPLLIADSISYINTDCTASIINCITDLELYGVIAFDDYRLITAATVANYFSLPCPNIPGLLNCRFKNRTRIKLGDTEINVKYKIFELSAQPELGNISYPCVIKPIDDSGSVGVKVCYSYSDTLEAIEFLRLFRVNSRGYTLTPQYMIEEYIDGEEFSAELYWSNIKHTWELLGITRKLITSGNYCVEIGHDFPWNLDSYNEITNHIKESLQKVHLDKTVAHVEFKINSLGILKIIEINPRPAGDMIHTLCLLATGFNIIEYYLALHVKDMNYTQRVSTNKAASIRFIMPPKASCIVNKIIKLNNFSKEIINYKFSPVPKIIKSVGSSYDRLGFIITSGDNTKETIRYADEAMLNIKLEYVEQ